jgi:hypothetical protein
VRAVGEDVEVGVLDEVGVGRGIGHGARCELGVGLVRSALLRKRMMKVWEDALVKGWEWDRSRGEEVSVVVLDRSAPSRLRGMWSGTVPLWARRI